MKQQQNTSSPLTRSMRHVLTTIAANPEHQGWVNQSTDAALVRRGLAEYVNGDGSRYPYTIRLTAAGLARAAAES